MIEIQHLGKTYNGKTFPISDISTTIKQGEVISIIGASGCGKSTFLRCLNRLDEPTSGRIFIEGEEITSPKCKLDKLRLKIGMVFQTFNLYEHLTVIENIILPQTVLLKRPRKEAIKRSMELLNEMGLASQYLSYPDQLSGGQKQRVAIARTLSTDPKIILFDEPTSALDPITTQEVQTVIETLSKSGRTMVIVTHSMDFARKISSRVMFFAQGTIYEEGTSRQIFENPQKPLTKKFIHSISSLEIDIDWNRFDYPNALAEITDFGSKHNLTNKFTNRLKALFEELCVIYLKNQPVKAIFEHSEKNRLTRLKVTIGKNELEKINLDDDSDISLKLIKAYSSRIFKENDSIVLEVADIK